MSAFVVSHTHIDALVSAGLAFARPTEPMAWYHAGPDGLERAYQLRPDNPTEVGAMLLAANHTSVNLLYGERAATESAYSFRRLAGVPDPVVVPKALACLEYQSCEHPEWATRPCPDGLLSRHSCHSGQEAGPTGREPPQRRADPPSARPARPVHPAGTARRNIARHPL
jgi:hypothetical protein